MPPYVSCFWQGGVLDRFAEAISIAAVDLGATGAGNPLSSALEAPFKALFESEARVSALATEVEEALQPAQ